MDRVGAEGFQEILSFLEVALHFFTSRLVLICNLVDDELGITVDLQGLHFYFFGKVESYYRWFILIFVV